MKRITKMLVLALALVAVFSMGAGSTAEAKTKVKVKKVTALDKATGKKVTSITLAKGGKAELSASVSVTPSKSANKKVGYKSSNKSIATVSSKGVITAKKKAGKATITVYSKKNKKKTAKVKVTVKGGISIKKVTLNKKNATLEGGKSLTLKATVNATPKKYKGTNKNVIWRSSNTKVATVSSKGKVTAKKPAKDTSVTITVYSKYNRNKKATCKIKVKGQPAPTPAPTPTPAKKKYTVLTPMDATVTVAAKLDTMTAANLEDVDRQLNTLAKAAVNKGDDIKVTINKNEYTAYYDGEKVTINGKKVSESVQAKNYKAGDDLTVVFSVKADKITALVPVAASYVKSVTVDELITLSEITSNQFKVGTTVCNYNVEGKTIVVEGDQTVFNPINGKCVTVSKVER